MNFDVLNEKFAIDVITSENTFDKIKVESLDLVNVLKFLKNNPQFDFDRLNTIIAIDLDLEVNQIELVYDLHSTKIGAKTRISVLLDRNAPRVPSVVEVYKSAYFDECEIFDMFGVTFNDNPNLKRLLMPKGWKGYPLRKDYVFDDERLAWSR